MSTTDTTHVQMGDTDKPAAPARTSRLFWSGVLLASGILAIYFAQVAWARLLFTPWYLPIGGTLAAVMALWATVRDVRWWRVLLVILCVGLAALEWQFMWISKLPTYSGPLGAGSGFPAFRGCRTPLI